MQQTALIMLINIMLQNYFKVYKCVHYIYNGNNDFLTTLNASVVVDKIENVTDFELNICDAFLIQVTNPVEVLKTIEGRIRYRRTYKYSFRRYMIVGNKEIVKSFASIYYLKDVMDLLIISASLRRGVFNLYHFESTNTGFESKLLANRWRLYNQTSLTKSSLFPEKMKGHYFYVGTFNYPPYNILDTKHGFELEILVEYCKRKECILKLIDHGEGNWGTLWRNFTGTGLYGCLLNGTCHAAIAGYYWQTEKPKFFDYVMPIGRIAGNCIVPMPRLETSWMLALLPFDKKTWLFILTSYLSVAVTWKLSLIFVSRQQLRIEISFTLLKLFLQQPINLKRRHKLNQYLQWLFVLALLLMLMFSVAYPSQLFKLTSRPRFTTPITNTDDLQESGIEWGTTRKTYLDILPQDKYAKLFERLVVDKKDILLQLMTQKPFALVVERLNNGFVTPTTINLQKFMTMKRDMFWIWETILLPLNSVWQPSLQRHILEVRASGLNEFWEQQAFQEIGLAKFHSQLKAQDTFKLSPLSLWQIRGVLLVWSIGILVSSVCFVVEKLKN